MGPTIPLNKVKNILVIIFKYHGDVILSSPVFSALKEALPEANIDVYLYKDTLPMLAGHPAIRAFFTYDQKWKSLSSWQRMKKEAANLNAVRSVGYDLTINMTKGDRGAIVSRVSKAPYRIGYEPDGGMVGQANCYSHLLKWTTTKRHMVERNLDTLRVIGVNPSLEVRDLVFSISLPDRFKVRALLDERNIEEYVLIHPASRMAYKHWPAEKFARLIERFLERGERVIISGGAGGEERRFVDEIQTYLGDNKVEDLLGLISLKELGVLIESSKLLVSVDSAPLHIASALKAKNVVLFGPSCDQTWGPWNNPNAQVVALNRTCRACEQKGCGDTWISDCLNNLSVDTVWEACVKYLPVRLKSKSLA
jgi:heptosyltransferase-3